MSKIKPTKEMLELRKKLELDRLAFQEKQNDYYQKTNPQKVILQKKREKLKSDRDLAVEAAIGYGLAIKAIEENIRVLDAEYDELEAKIQSEAPRNTYYDRFKSEFGISEHEIEWAEAEL